jgi:two-component system chemotaxis response regulator CheB
MLSRDVDAVVIGASAGAIDALSQILPRLPAALPVPIFVVVHVPPRLPSLLCQIFAERCPLPVCEAQDKLPIRAGTVYFAPPDYHLLIEDRDTLALSIEEPVNFSRPSLDVLFESAAEVYGARLLAIVLSGASRDGARGAAEVRQRGGIVAVQDPRTADSKLMPTAVIAVAEPMFVGSLAQLAAFTVRTVCGATPT